MYIHPLYTSLRCVPQVSILGPLQFSIYICIITSYLNNCSLKLYADDAQIYLPFDPSLVQDAARKINEDLVNLVTFSESHNLVLNLSKCYVILFGRKKINTPLTFQQCVKNLGLYIDTKVKFRVHVNKCIQKA